MAIDFQLEPELCALQARVRDFVAAEIIPLEADARRTRHGPTEEFRRELVERARHAGLLAPQVAPEFGGLGLSHRARAVVFEEAGYSPLGPVALNVFAPDEGNMHLLEAVATPAQKERWLRPLAAGTLRSCFCMTEPPPGAGSDPSMLLSTATRDGDAYVIDGGKWFITGADGAAFAIIMARVADSGATMFLSDMNASGIVVERSMATLDECFPGGHGVVRFDGLRVPPTRCWAKSARAFITRRSGSRPRASLTACAGSARFAGRTTSPSTTQGGVTRSAGGSVSTKESASCSPTMRWTCMSPG